MTRLPPLADLVAVRAADAEEAGRVRGALDATCAFDVAWSPHPLWAIATRSYVGGEADPDEVRQAGLAFVDGRDRVDRSWEEVAKLTERSAGRLWSIPGDAAFIAVHASGDATVVRSPSGRVPFYIARGPAGVTIATSLRLLIEWHDTALRIDPLINAAWTSGFDAPIGRRTLLDGVKAPRRGEHAIVTARTTRFGRQWDPRRDARPEVSSEHPARLRALLLDGLDRELDPDGENLLTLSAGVDSSSVGALGAGTLGRRTTTLTVLTESPPIRERELRYIEALASQTPIERRTEIVFDEDLRLDALDEPQVPFHVTQPFLCLLRRAAAAGRPSVIYGGEFADHTVGSALTRFDWARHTTPVGLLRRRRQLPMGWVSVRKWATYWGRRPIGRPVMPFADGLPAMVRTELHQEYDEWLRDRRRRAARDTGSMPYLAMFLEREGLLGMHWEITSALGIRRCYPFVTREVLEFAFECHPHELVGRTTKRLLRAALRDDVPAENLQRPDKGRVGPPVRFGPREWDLDLPGELSAVLTDGYPPPAPMPYWEAYRLRQLRAFVRTLAAVPRRRAGIG